MPRFYTPETITLRAYLKISENSNYRLMLIDGKATDKQCEDAWKAIVEDNNKQSDNLDFFNYLELVKERGNLLADYNEIKASILRLLFAVDKEIIENLAQKGYTIDTSSNTAYRESVMASLNRINGLTNRLRMNETELQGMVEDVPNQKVTYERIKAHLTTALGFNVEEDMTLALYREYKSILNQKRVRVVDED